MKKKAYIFLVLSILVGVYLLFGVVTIFTNYKNYTGIADYIIALIVLGIVLILEVFLFKKYRFYRKAEKDLGTYSINEKQDDKSNGAVKNTIKPKKKKGCLTAIIVFLGLSVFSGYIGMKNMPESDKVPANIGILMKKMSIEKESAIQIDSILEQCEVKGIKDIVRDEVLDNNYGQNEKGYRIQNDISKNIILYLKQDNTIHSIKYADNFLYNDNKVIQKLSDYSLTLDEASILQSKSQDMVKEFLKAPSTAKFPNINDWAFSKTPEKIVIQSYVDAQNSFGAMIRSEFQITLTPDGKTVTSFIFEGQERISQ